MTPDVVRLLELPVWRALDVDEEGRVLASSDEPGSTQLFEIEPDGTRTRLTDLPGDVSGRYLPANRAVIVQHDVDRDDSGQLSLLRLDDAPANPATHDELQPIVRDPKHVHRVLDVLPDRILLATNRRDGADFDVLIHSVLTGEERVIYDKGGTVLEVAASPDSHYVALTLPGPESGTERIVLVNTMPPTGDEEIVELSGAQEHCANRLIGWLPDDSGLLVTSNHGRDLTAIARIDPHSGARGELVTSDEYELTGWLSPDGSTLLVHSNNDGSSELSLHAADTGEFLRAVDLPEAGWCFEPLPDPVWANDSRHVVISFTSPTRPGDVIRLENPSCRSQIPTASSEPLIDRRLTRPTVHRVPSFDEQLIPCLVYEPDNPRGSAVLIIHDGPAGQSAYSFDPIAQGLVTQGHTVVLPNVRGSTGYGHRWQAADDRLRRLDAVVDLAALHDWLPTIGVDASRTALWGDSYGGYLVLAGLAFQPDRWAAGVDVAGVPALRTYLRNTADHRRTAREREFGSATSDAEFLDSASPLHKADEIRAPLFMVHGADDPRVPLSEARRVADAVGGGGNECELLVYEDEGRVLTKRANRIDAYSRAVEFLGRHLR